MSEENWYKELTELAKTDPACRDSLEKVKQLEPEFLALCRELSPRQRQTAEAYLSACEEMDHALTALAWMHGKQTA